MILILLSILIILIILDVYTKDNDEYMDVSSLNTYDLLKSALQTNNINDIKLLLPKIIMMQETKYKYYANINDYLIMPNKTTIVSSNSNVSGVVVSILYAMDTKYVEELVKGITKPYIKYLDEKLLIMSNEGAFVCQNNCSEVQTHYTNLMLFRKSLDNLIQMPYSYKTDTFMSIVFLSIILANVASIELSQQYPDIDIARKCLSKSFDIESYLISMS